MNNKNTERGKEKQKAISPEGKIVEIEVDVSKELERLRRRRWSSFPRTIFEGGRAVGKVLKKSQAARAAFVVFLIGFLFGIIFSLARFGSIEELRPSFIIGISFIIGGVEGLIALFLKRFVPTISLKKNYILMYYYQLFIIFSTDSTLFVMEDYYDWW